MSRTFLPALLAVCSLWAMACGGPDEPSRAGEPWFEGLTQSGAFLPYGLWIDFGALYEEEQQTLREKAWHLGEPRAMVIEDGWGGPEDWGAWAMGERTRIHFHLRPGNSTRPPETYDLFLEAMAAEHPEGRTQGVTVFLNGVEAGRFQAVPEWREYRLSLLSKAFRPGANLLELVYDFHLPGDDYDDRPRALAFQRLGLIPSTEPSESWARPDPGYRLFPNQEILVLEESGSWIVPFAVPRDAAELTFEVAFEGPAPKAEARMSIELRGLDGSPAERLEIDAPTLAKSAAETGASRAVLRLDLAEARERSMILAFGPDLPGGGRFTLRAPRLKRGAALERPALELPSFSEQPPVVVIVLDAARADHVGVYGYRRETTPHIDRLAEKSMVFRQTIAECSYTLCSMPGLMNGLSFVQHGLIVPGLRLDAAASSLAERLAAAGYQTAGLTGNPNNSSLTGAERGFADFRQIWEVHPDAITGAAIELIEAAAADEDPLYLMLHYVPPHEPYTPDPEFDLFGDPFYAGPITGERENVLPVFDREVSLEPADLEELVALYDGNLRMADHAVGRVLAALERAGLYDEALIVVTSDHGEAMMEHGWVGHNSTIYEEMLHVPLIVKWPAAWRERLPPVDLERLTGLADIPVTILRLLGLEAPTEMVAPPLFTPAGPVEERVFLLRSANGERPHLGIRSQRFKAIERRGELPELYDLQADPGERNNLAFEHPVLHAGLIRLFAQSLETARTPRAEQHQEELSEKDREMLRSLGYL